MNGVFVVERGVPIPSRKFPELRKKGTGRWATLVKSMTEGDSVLLDKKHAPVFGTAVRKNLPGMTAVSRAENGKVRCWVKSKGASADKAA